MSHITIDLDQGSGPLSTYNSLTDSHLTGYFSSPRKRKHLRNVGLINRTGYLVSENTFRLNMARKEHKRHIKNTLAQAIVEKTLELERQRQNVIKQKLEEIAKLELVHRVRDEEKQQPIRKWSSRPNSGVSQKSQKSRSPSRAQSASEKRRRDVEDILPFLSPRSPRRPISGPAPSKPGGSPKGKYRPISAPENNRPESGSTKTSTNYDEDDDDDVEYLDENGRPISPPRNGELSHRNETVDFSQLYTLNTAALRKYAMTLARLEQNRGGSSPYVTTQIPIPPRSPRIVSSSSRSRRYNGTGGISDRSPTRRTANGQVYLHHTESITTHPGQLQSMVEIRMKYHGWNLSLARDEIDPRNLVVIEQQHCGGNTLTVYKEKLLPKSDFTFVSHRHRGYPFSLTIYVDGRMDSRVSTCCEYRHGKNVRLGGANGHFSFVNVKGNGPCYKCRVTRGGKKKKKQKSKPETATEEVTVVETYPVSENVGEEKDKQQNGKAESESEDTGNYDDDFEDSDAETKEKKNDESQDEEIDEREIRGFGAESPAGSGSRSPTIEVERDTDSVQVINRKIDAYSSEEEDLEGDKTKVIVVQTQAKDMALRKRTSQPDPFPDQTKDNKKIRSSKSVPVRPQKGGRSPRADRNADRSKFGNKEPVSEDSSSETESSESSSTPSPRRQEVLTPEPIVISSKKHKTIPQKNKKENKSKSPEIFHNIQNDQKIYSETSGGSATPDVATKNRKNSKTKSPDSPKNNQKSSRPETPDSQGDGSKSSSKPSSKPSSPVKTPDIIHTVWSEEDSESANSKGSRKSSPEQCETWNDKRKKIVENIADKFGRNEEEIKYEADDEDTERSNQLVAEEIVKKFGEDDQTANKHVTKAIIETFGQDGENSSDKNTQDANNLRKQYGELGRDRRSQDVAEQLLKQFGVSMDEEKDNKPRRISEEILREFGEDSKPSGEVSQKESATEEFGSRNSDLAAEKKRQIGEEMIKYLGKDPADSQKHEESIDNKRRRFGKEIVKQFGDDSTSTDQRIAKEIVKQFGDDSTSKDHRVAEEIVKQFGDDSTSKDQRIAEEIVKQFGDDSTSKDQRVAEEIVKQFGDDSTSKDQRVAEEIIKLYGTKTDTGINDRISESEANKSRPWKHEIEIKDNFKRETPEQESDEKPIRKEANVLVSKSLPEDPSRLRTPPRGDRNSSDTSNSESLNSTEREIKTKKRDSEQFFKPALEKKQTSVSSSDSESSSGSDSSSDSDSSTDEEPAISSSKQPVPVPQKSENLLKSNEVEGSSSLTPLTTNSSSILPAEDAATALMSAKEDSQQSKHKTNDSDTEDSSSDSGSDSSGSSSSDSGTETKKVLNTGKAQQQEREKTSGNGEKQEKDEISKAEKNENQSTDETIETDKNDNQTNANQNDEANRRTEQVKVKTVTFRNTPEPIENHVTSDSEAENMHGGNDPDNVASDSSIVRTYLSKTGVESGKVHGGSIKHLLDADSDIQLDGITLDKHQIQEICVSLEESEEVKTLSLRNSGLKDDDIDKITDAIILSPSEPVMINLNLNELTSKSMEKMVEIMRAEPTLDILLLQGNQIGDEGARILADGIIDIHHEARKRRKTTLLRQSSELQVVQGHSDKDNTLTPRAPPQRRNSLFDPAREARFCRLGELDLGDADLTDEGVEHIARMLEQNVYIETLSLSSNPEITKHGWIRLGQALEKNRRLQNLTLDFNNLGDDGMTFLCRGLKDNRSLVAIDLEETGIGERGGRMLVELLKRNTTILDMTLTPGNNIPESILLEIKRFLALNKATEDSYNI